VGVHIGTQKHANCSSQSLKCFTTHLSWDRQPINFPDLWIQKHPGRMWQLALYQLYFLLFVCLVCAHCIQDSFLLHKSNTD